MRRPLTACKTLALALALAGMMPGLARSEDGIEEAGVAVGVTAGNMWFLPAKFISMSMGLLSGGLSYIATGGNAGLTQQIWQDTLQGPYMITPEVARKSIGQRPELSEKK